MANILPEELESWSERTDSEGRLPELIQRLLVASVHMEAPRFPIEKLTRLKGYDGIAKIHGKHSLIPQGDCVFEFGTDKDPTHKANSDYLKRTKSPLGVAQGKTHYIQISSRKWPNALVWSKKKSQRTKWRSVRAIGAIELANWLDSRPSVGRWAAKYLLNSQANYGSLYIPEECLEMSAAGENIEQYKEALITSNRKICSDLLEWMGGHKPDFSYEGDPQLLGALLHGLILKLEEPYRNNILSNSLVILDSSKWDEILDHHDGQWVVLGKTGNNIPWAIQKKGFKILFPKNGNSTTKLLIVQDPRLVDASRRKNGLIIPGSFPDWLKDDRAGVNIGLWLVGSWVDGSNDMAVVNSMSGREQRNLEEFIRREINQGGIPLKRIGKVYRVELRTAYYRTILELISESDLQRLSQACNEVLAEKDPRLDLPKNQRFYGQALGALRKYSFELRQGLADTLLIITGHIQSQINAVQSFRQTVVSIVRGLLINIDTWKDITKLNDIMMAISEAAPDEFITSLDRVLQNKPQIFRDMFEENPDIGESTYATLMNSLERLAWYPQTIASVLVLLAGLDELTPPGLNVYPQPRYAALKSANLSIRNTAASQEQILEALDAVRRQYPNVWWVWAEQLVQKSHAGDLDEPPSFLGIENMEKLRSDFDSNFQSANLRLLNIMLQEVGQREERWAFLVSILPYQNVEIQKTIIRGITEWASARGQNEE